MLPAQNSSGQHTYKHYLRQHIKLHGGPKLCLKISPWSSPGFVPIQQRYPNNHQVDSLQLRNFLITLQGRLPCWSTTSMSSKMAAREYALCLAISLQFKMRKRKTGIEATWWSGSVHSSEGFMDAGMTSTQAQIYDTEHHISMTQVSCTYMIVSALDLKSV